MCGGAMISDFITAKRSRKLTTQDFWSELDTISDLLGFDSNRKDHHLYGQFNNKVAQNPKQLNKVRNEKSTTTTTTKTIMTKRVKVDGKEGKKSKRTRKNIYRGIKQRPWGKWAAEIRDPQKRCIVGPESTTQWMEFSFPNELFDQNEELRDGQIELKEQIWNLESFLGLEPEQPQPIELEKTSESELVDLWMLQDLPLLFPGNHHSP